MMPSASLGYGNSTGHEFHLDDVCRVLSTPLEVKDSEIPTILIAHARGTSGGDEERLRDLGVDINTAFWHFVDSQTLASDDSELPRGQKWSLARTLSELCNLEPMTAQKELEKSWNSRPVQHNAQDDAYCTLLSFVHMVIKRSEQLGLSFKKGPRALLLAIDFEGGGGPTTEVGLAGVQSNLIFNPQWRSEIFTHHVVVFENRNLHPCIGAQRGKMQLDSRRPKTYPRNNTRTGPHGTEKQWRSVGGQRWLMSPDTIFKSESQVGQWLLTLLPLSPSARVAAAEDRYGQNHRISATWAKLKQLARYGNYSSSIARQILMQQHPTMPTNILQNTLEVLSLIHTLMGRRPTCPSGQEPA